MGGTFSPGGRQDRFLAAIGGTDRDLFTNELDEWKGEANRVLFNGSGLAAGDFDNDGLPDLYFCSLQGRNALYKNLGGGAFKNVTAESGIVCPGQNYRGAVFADVNGDGWLDLFVTTTGGGVLCFTNDGRGKFADATAFACTASKYGSVTLALADVDGNGTLDLYVCNYRKEDIRDRGQVHIQMVRGQLTIPPHLKDRLVVVNGQVIEYGEPDQLYLNDGKGYFTPVSWTNGALLDEAGKPLSAPPLDWGLTATFRDLNGDGQPDLYVCNDYWTPDRIWINTGNGHFRAIEKLALRSTSASSMGVDFADIDRDGYADFFVVDMLSRDSRLRKRQMLAQTPAASPLGAIDNRPQFMRNTLFHNRGDGTFEEVANYAALPASDWSWSPVFVDVDLDGFEDLVIPAGHYRDVQDLDAEREIKTRQRSFAGFTNAVERRKAFIDEKVINNRLYPRLEMPIIAYRNLGNLKFEEVTRLWGTDTPGVHHAIAFADLDGDGDLDFVVNNLGSPVGFYRNDSSAPRVAVRLKGEGANTQGIGSKVKLLNGSVPMQSQEVVAGGRYMAGSDPQLVFAAGNAKGSMSLEVTWRAGKKSVITGVMPNRIYEVDEAGAGEGKVQSSKVKVQSAQVSVGRKDEPASSITDHGARTTDEQKAQSSKVKVQSAQSSVISRQSSVAPGNEPTPTDHGPRTTDRPETRNQKPETAALFEDVSQLLQHTHHDDPYDDFARQPLLPQKLSQLGPGVAWCDLNNDGHADLVIGTGRGGELAVYLNDGHGGFIGKTNPAPKAIATRDYTTILSFAQPDGRETILAGLANYEDGLAVGTCVRQYDFSPNRFEDVIPAFASSVGPLALADLDGDGHLDLFIGGRVIPSRYPEAADSQIFRFDSNSWKLDAENSRRLQKVGLVSGAVWSDLDGDGFPELVLACEWGPVRVFKNAARILREVTTELGLDRFTGRWNGVTTGDFDGDGRLDIVASNWGLNCPYHATPEKPLQLYFGNLNGQEMVDLIEAEYDAITGEPAPQRRWDVLAASLPFLYERFSSFKAFSETTVAAALAPQRDLVHVVQANTLASMVFLNRGNKFEPILLPREAQLAPAFGVAVADFDGDGAEDIFVSQNFFANQPENPRFDAGRGVLLLGDGTGNFRAVPGQDSGINVYGEQRGAAVADFDRDGRVDLAVTQNGAATRLFRNVTGKPGLRVRLIGPSSNPQGIGAQVRLLFGKVAEPVREIHGGSGYWSQDSAVQVFAVQESLPEIWIRWPGRRALTTQLPAGLKEVAIDSSGKIVLGQ